MHILPPFAGTQNVLAAARQAKIPRFVHIGTEAILLHDRFPIHMADESVPAPLPSFHVRLATLVIISVPNPDRVQFQKLACCPQAPYTRSKILAERVVLVRT